MSINTLKSNPGSLWLIYIRDTLALLDIVAELITPVGELEYVTLLVGRSPSLILKTQDYLYDVDNISNISYLLIISFELIWLLGVV